MNIQRPYRAESREAELVQEGQMMATYLVDERVPQDLLDRYLRANEMLFPEVWEHGEDPVVSFVRRRPWTLPFLDGACGMIRPQTMLRKKILLMVALLEASPNYTHLFIPDRVPVHRFWIKMVRFGLTSVLKVMIGLCLFPFAVKMK